MIYIALNAVPILVATLAALAFGALWYRPRAVTAGVALTALLAEFWLAAILAGALILAPPKGSVWTMTIGSAVVIWIGFVAPAILATDRLRGRTWRATLADAGHWLGAMLVMAVVLRLIGLVPPPA